MVRKSKLNIKKEFFFSFVTGFSDLEEGHHFSSRAWRIESDGKGPGEMAGWDRAVYASVRTCGWTARAPVNAKCCDTQV